MRFWFKLALFASLPIGSLFYLNPAKAATYIFDQSYEQEKILVNGLITTSQTGTLTEDDLNNASYSIQISNSNTGTNYFLTPINSTWRTFGNPPPRIEADNSFLTIEGIDNGIGSLLLESDSETSQFWGYFYSCSSSCVNGLSFVQVGLINSPSFSLALPSFNLSFTSQDTQIPEPSNILALLIFGLSTFKYIRLK